MIKNEKTQEEILLKSDEEFRMYTFNKINYLENKNKLLESILRIVISKVPLADHDRDNIREIYTLLQELETQENNISSKKTR